VNVIKLSRHQLDLLQGASSHPDGNLDTYGESCVTLDILREEGLIEHAPMLVDVRRKSKERDVALWAKDFAYCAKRSAWPEARKWFSAITQAMEDLNRDVYRITAKGRETVK